MKGLVLGLEVIDDYVALTVSPFDGDFAAIQDAVGGYVEAIPTHERVTMWCNEDGKSMGLIQNIMAEQVWRLYDSFGCLAHGDWLVGNIVVLGPRATGEAGPICADLPHEERVLVIAACVAWPS